MILYFEPSCADLRVDSREIVYFIKVEERVVHFSRLQNFYTWSLQRLDACIRERKPRVAFRADLDLFQSFYPRELRRLKQAKTSWYLFHHLFISAGENVFRIASIVNVISVPVPFRCLHLGPNMSVWYFNTVWHVTDGLYLHTWQMFSSFFYRFFCNLI